MAGAHVVSAAAGEHLMYTVDVLDRSLQAVDTGRLTLVPRNWEAQATGGPTVATIDGTGAAHAQ